MRLRASRRSPSIKKSRARAVSSPKVTTTLKIRIHEAVQSDGYRQIACHSVFQKIT